MADCKRCFLGENDACYPHVAEDKECDIFRPMTNADCIRSMTDEELAKWRSRGQCPTGHYHGDYDCMNRSCKDCWLEWLKENDEI